MATDSISFDNAASFYDKTRSLSPEAAARVTEMLQSELAGRSPVFETGVGTGRIALPLAEAGIEMMGLDLARNMLARLVENAGGRMVFPLVQGDATRLPFRDDSFAAAIASWVLHLIPGWRDVLTELTRVVAEGGVLLLDVGREHQSIVHDMTWKFRELANVTDWPRGAKSYMESDEVLVPLGAQPRDLDPKIETIETTLEEHIQHLENGIYSVSWGVDETTRKRATGELREWAEREYGSLTEPREIVVDHRWRAYDL